MEREDTVQIGEERERRKKLVPAGRCWDTFGAVSPCQTWEAGGEEGKHICPRCACQDGSQDGSLWLVRLLASASPRQSQGSCFGVL